MARAAELYDETFNTGGTVKEWLDTSAFDKDAIFRGAMFATAHEAALGAEAVEVNDILWRADDLRAAYALAWVEAEETLRQPVGDGESALDPALFHTVFTEWLVQGHTVVSGRSDGAGNVYTSFELQGFGSGSSRAPGPVGIDRDQVEDILRHDVIAAAGYHFMFTSIPTTRGFASESYILATDADDEIIAGWWLPSDDSIPLLLPTRIWIAPERPEQASGPMQFVDLDLLRDAFEN